MPTYIHTYSHAYINTRTHAYIHTYIPAYIPTNMHPYLHACTGAEGAGARFCGQVGRGGEVVESQAGGDGRGVCA